MKFRCLWIRQSDNNRKEVDYTEQELSAIVGTFVVDRAIELGETNTTVINQAKTYKLFIKYLKN